MDKHDELQPWQIQKTQETLGKLSKKKKKKKKHRHLFGTIWSTMDRKHPKTAIFPDALFFYTSPGICRRFPTSGPIPNAPKRHFFYRRSYTTGPNHALEKVLTTETPCMFPYQTHQAQKICCKCPLGQSRCKVSAWRYRPRESGETLCEIQSQDSQRHLAYTPWANRGASKCILGKSKATCKTQSQRERVWEFVLDNMKKGHQTN